METGPVQLRDPKKCAVDPECFIPDLDSTLKQGQEKKIKILGVRKKSCCKTYKYYSKLFYGNTFGNERGVRQILITVNNIKMKNVQSFREKSSDTDPDPDSYSGSGFNQSKRIESDRTRIHQTAKKEQLRVPVKITERFPKNKTAEGWFWMGKTT